MSTLGYIIADWVYMRLDPNYLYTIAVSASGSSAMLKWSMVSHTWQVVATFPNVPGSVWGALYGRSDGTIFASDNTSGDIWAFSITTFSATFSTRGPSTSSNDGARCMNA
ncbi:hypothetical protein BX600DRAFT_513659 [Xylariales sp. PMI_506]|nr:hypothetical protein BX600DRAFT_513659 [Xylariales sp. PMI_506]